MSDVTTAPVDSKLFRRVMGSFATGVTVITATVDDSVRGMTANAFMSGSLTPPLCIISVEQIALLHVALKWGSRCGVGLLAGGGVRLSGTRHRAAKGGGGEPF